MYGPGSLVGFDQLFVFGMSLQVEHFASYIVWVLHLFLGLSSYTSRKLFLI